MKGYEKLHRFAVANPRNAFESTVPELMRIVEQYAAAHLARYESPVGEDGIIGDEAILPILRAAITLLNGEHGRLDAGTLDGQIRELAERVGFTGELE